MKTKNNKSKILIVAFIFTITLLIVGVSYAYFTATTSNSNNQQINLETGTLSLIFSDNNNGFNVQLQPEESAEKTFTIQNNGDIEAAASMSFLNLINNYLPESLIYSLSYSETENGQYKYLNIDNVPTSSSRTTREISNGIIVPANTTYYYKFKVRLVNLQGTNQNSDINATMNTKFKIDSVNLPSNIGKSDQTLQKLQSLNSTITVTSGTPDFKYNNEGAYMSDALDLYTDNSKISNGLYAMDDDYGTSYYFRGNVANNYVFFGGSSEMCCYWRIIRINGDGTLRLLFDSDISRSQLAVGQSYFNTSDNDNAFIGYMHGYENVNGTIETKSYEEAHINKHNSTIKSYLDDWYISHLSAQSSKIADSIFCNDRSLTTDEYKYYFNGYSNLGYGDETTFYGSNDRKYCGVDSYCLENAHHMISLKCPQRNDRFTVNDKVYGNSKLTYPIGLITMDELYLAGNSSATTTSAYTYKIRGYDSNILSYWSMSPSAYTNYESHIFALGAGIDSHSANDEYMAVVPVINLTQEAVMSMTGSGTIEDPFRA